MRLKLPQMVIALALVLGPCVAAFAEVKANNDDQIRQLQQQVQALQGELASMKAQNEGSWLNERRAEEIKGLVRDVLADAETRASLQESVMTAGINEKGKIYLQTPDKSFYIQIAGQIQFRAIFNNEESRNNVDDNASEFGFQLRRTKLKFKGHIGSPSIKYNVVLAMNRASGNAFFEDVYMSYDFETDGMVVVGGGLKKLPFLWQELTSSSRQLSVDRAPATEFFTLNRAEQVFVQFNSDIVKAVVAISDGANSTNTDLNADQVEVALTGRVDVKIAGSWGQFKDFTSWSGDGFGARAGAAVHYQLGDGNNAVAAFGSPAFADYTAITMDGQVEFQGAHVFVAGMAGFIDGDDSQNGLAPQANRSMYGFLIEGGYNIADMINPFVRYEFIDDDVMGTEQSQIFTVGANVYLRKHNAKFTVDVLYATEGQNINNTFGASEYSSGLGLQGKANGNDQVAVRAQFQLLF